MDDFLTIYKLHFIISHLPTAIALAIALLQFSNSNHKKFKNFLQQLLIFNILLLCLTGIGLAFQHPKWSTPQIVHFIVGTLTGVFCAWIIAEKRKRFSLYALIFLIVTTTTGFVSEYGTKYLNTNLSFTKKELRSARIKEDNQYRFFHQNVRPILERKCLSCHNTDFNHAEVILDDLNAIEGEGQFTSFYTSKKPYSSKFLKSLLRNPVVHDHMPFLSGTLSDKELQTIETWIARGGFTKKKSKPSDELKSTNDIHLVNENHWSFKRFQKPQINKEKLNKDPRISNEIDLFLVDQVKSSPKMKKGKQLRKLSVSLTGLFPKPSDIKKFKKGQKTYNEYVNQYLSSYEFGRNMALFWFDFIGFAETFGLEQTKTPIKGSNQYKKFVIKQFNNDFNYLQSLKNQLEVQSKFIAAFENKNILKFQPRFEKDNFVSSSMALDNVFSFGLGVKMKCANCHDHVYAPISNDQYYSLLSSFIPIYRLKDIETHNKRKNKGKHIAPELPQVYEGTNDDFRFWKEYRDSDKPGHNSHRLQWTEIANWLTEKKDGVGIFTARIFVNAVWKNLMGKGIITDGSDVLHIKKEPRHIKLLNWLTYDFIGHGSSVKHLVKKIVTSRYFRSPILGEKDSLSPKGLRKIRAENIRDNMLNIAGILNLNNQKNQTPKELKEMLKSKEKSSSFSKDKTSLLNRRSVHYARTREEDKSYFMKRYFDIPDGYKSTSQRSPSPTVKESFFYLNDKFIKETIELYIKKYASLLEEDQEMFFNKTYRMFYSRLPSPKEKSILKKMMHKKELSTKIKLKLYFRVLLTSNEFIYLK